MSEVNNLDNKRIAKNTLFLYFRMLLIMGVSLFTSRIVLKALGVDDYGIYNLVGGFVTIFAIISNTLVVAMQRFFNIALAKQDNERFSDVFIMSMNILLLMSLLIILISETVGIWFVNTQLNIKNDRMYAAYWVFQFSIITFIINILRTPYNAAIIAYEKMSFYAYVSIFEVLLQLFIAYVLLIYSKDRLIMYSILFFVTNLIINYLYKYFCNKKLNVCKYKLKWNKDLFKELMGFTGWSLLGQSGYIIRAQGDSFLVNRFYSVTVNAAMGVNSQVNKAVTSFVKNFQLAFAPQVIKSYAANEMNEHYKLLFRSSKFSAYLLIILSLPIIFNIDFILNIWLEKVPIYTSQFVIIGLSSSLILAMSGPLASSINATGKIRNYQIFLMIINILGLITSFFLLKCGHKPYIVSIVNFIVQSIIFISRIFFMKKLVDLDVKKFLIEVVFPVVLVILLSLIFPYLTHNYFKNFWGVLFICIVIAIVTSLIIYIFGLKKEERRFIISYVKKFINKFK